MLLSNTMVPTNGIAQHRYANCSMPSKIGNASHKIPLQTFKDMAPEIIDIITRNAQLKVERYTKKDSTLIVYCGVWYNAEIEMLDRAYIIQKNLRNGTVRILQDYDKTTDFSDLKLYPTLDYRGAFNSVYALFSDDMPCLWYNLGIVDKAQLNGGTAPQYALVWKFEGIRTANVAYVDAHSGIVLKEIPFRK